MSRSDAVLGWKFDKVEGWKLRFVLENVSLGLARFVVLRGSIW